MTTKPIKFSKMHGLGNDFMVVNALTEPFNPDKNQISQLADRHTGVGFDQLLVIEPSKKADYFCRIYNSDGSEAEQCGNGLRCIGRYLYEKEIHPATKLKLETLAGLFEIKINRIDSITVVIPIPQLAQKEIELATNDSNEQISLNTISLGNPHAILKTSSVDSIPVSELGSFISTHPVFGSGTNVGFMEVMDRNHIQLRTFERGAGETHACGSNACAATIVGIKQGWLDKQVTVSFRLGDLLIEWMGDGEPLYMTGPAALVYDAVISGS